MIISMHGWIICKKEGIFMNGIIVVNYETKQPTVSARELHKALEIKKRFSSWFETNSQGFIEGEDFSKPYLKVRVQNEGNREVQREVEDYDLSVDMAKHICLMSRTEKGKQCRQYLIDLEKAWNTPEQVMARALKMADQTINKLKTEVKQQEVIIEQQSIQLERQRPFVEIAVKLQRTKDTISMSETAKALTDDGINLGRNDLMLLLREKKILGDGSGKLKKNEPYAKYTKEPHRCFTYSFSLKTDKYGKERMIPVTRVTGKGLIFLNKKLREWLKLDELDINIDLDSLDNSLYNSEDDGDV